MKYFVIKNIYIDLHSDQPITDPPGLNLDAVQLELDGALYVSENRFGDRIVELTRQGKRFTDLLHRYMYAKKAIIASFVAPLLQEQTNGI